MGAAVTSPAGFRTDARQVMLSCFREPKMQLAAELLAPDGAPVGGACLLLLLVAAPFGVDGPTGGSMHDLYKVLTPPTSGGCGCCVGLAAIQIANRVGAVPV